MGNPKPLPREKDGLWLTEDNKLIMMHGNMTVISHKLTNYFLWLAQHENKLKGLSVDCRTVLQDCNIKGTNFSQILLEECKRVARTQISIIDSDGNWHIRQIIPNMDYENGILTADINPEIVPYIQGLAGNFTRSNLLIVNKCNTYPSFRLYKVCNSWVRTGYAYYSIEEWRNILGSTGKSYDRFIDFKKRVLIPSIKIVNEKTDLDIMEEFVKTGRKITHMKVYIKKKNCSHVEDAEYQTIAQPLALPEQSQEDVLDGFSLAERDVIRKMVSDYKQPLKHAEKYMLTYGVEYCKEQMEYVRQESKHKKIDKIGGYFRRAIENDYAGSRQAQIAAVQEEEDEHKDIAAWNREIRKGSLFSFASDDEDLVQQILEGHPEVAEMYRGMGMPDEKIARWLEKYPEVLLLKTGVRLQTEDYVTAEYVEAALTSEQTKGKRLGGRQAKESFHGDGEDGKGHQGKGLESISKIIEEASPEDEYTIWLKKKNAIRHDLIEKMKTNPEKFSLEMLKQALAKYDEMCPCPLPQTDRTNSD